MPIKTTTFPFGILTTVAAILLALFSGCIWFYQAEKSAARQQVQKQLAAIAHLKVDQIVAWRNARLDDAAVLTESPFLAEGIARFLAHPDASNTEELRQRFQSIQRHYHYTDVLLVTPEGKVHLSLSGTATTNEHSMAALTEALAERKPVLVDLESEPLHPEPHVKVVAPIFAVDGQAPLPLGAIILIHDAGQSLYPLVQSWPLPTQTAETLLVRREGETVLFLNNLRHHQGAALTLRLPLTRTEVAAVRAVQGQEGLSEGLDYQGVASLAFTLAIPDSPWFIVVKDDSAEIYAGWRVRATLILLLLTALTAGLGALGLIARQYHRRTAYYHTLYDTEARLRASLERQSITLKAVGDGVIATDRRGYIELLNPVAETLTGWTQEEACGRPLTEVFRIVNEETREPAENPVTKALRQGLVVGLSNHTLLIAKDGFEWPIADSAAPIRDDRGEITGVVLVFRDQTDERRTHRLIQVRLALVEYAATHTLDELLTNALDEIGALVASPIGFYHFIDADQETIALQQWSTRTLKEFCRAAGGGIHYPLDQAGVWADCIRQRQPVIHNDYASLPDKKGMPAGHATLVRELVVPILRAGKVVAILGVGNKPEPYTEEDLETVSYLSDVMWQFVEQKQVEEELLSSGKRYRTLYQNMMDAFVVVDMQGRIMECNESFSSMLGYSEEELRQLRYADATPAKWHQLEMMIVKEQVIPRGSSGLYEKEYQRQDGTVIPVELRTFLIVNDQGQPEGMSAIVRDISERKWAEEERGRLQAQLNQAQKMESVGRLAGGVAHDFNNMLSVILGYAELALGKVNPSDPLYRHLQEIFNAGKRSAEITRQLLAFARKQTIAPKVLDLNKTVEGMLKMLRRLIGEDINLAWLPGAGLWPVKIDPSQMDQLLANLCVNARDAIEGVGKVTIETGTVTFDQAYCNDHVGFPLGDFVLLTISDDGCGMDKEIIDKIFEPFFTTKEEGRGTGLGLATVYGIVKQNSGFINVYSEPGQGTTFNIYLPGHEGQTAEIQGEISMAIPPGHGETILIVEDEMAILELSRTMLERLGYTVLTANTPAEAILLAKAHADEIHLLLTDVVMPEMNGRELAEHLHTLYPRIETLFMSGYTTNVIAHRGILKEGVRFIHKPFSTKDLATKVHEALRPVESGAISI